MECPICFYDWNADTTMPIILNCGHSICIKCCNNFFIDNKISCATCSFVTSFSVKKQQSESKNEFATRCIDSLPKNHSLLSLIPSRSSAKPKAREYRYGMRCKDHDLLIHSYVARPYSMLCDSCLEDIKSLNLKIIPFPEALEYCKENINKLRQTINEIKESIVSPELATEESIKQEFEEHFNTIRNKIQYAHEFALAKIAEKIKIFKENYKIQHKKCEDTLSRIKINEQKLNYLNSRPLNEIISERQYLENLLNSSKLKGPPNKALPFLSIDLQFKQDSVEVLKDFICSSLNIKLKKHSRREKWKCKLCSTLNIEGKVQCECSSFRPVESYPNLLKNPMAANAEEISEMQQRREIEMNLINSLDSSEECNSWYLINADWVSGWKNFVFNKASRPGVNVSGAGILPPGPINNKTLLKENGELKPKLKPAVHYRAVNKKVWEAYVFIYTGGPEIVRKSLNIYE